MYKLPEWRTIINDKKHDKWINEGRFTLFQNDEGNLMIYIRDINQRDAGRYAIDVLHNQRIYMILNIKGQTNYNQNLCLIKLKMYNIYIYIFFFIFVKHHRFML